MERYDDRYDDDATPAREARDTRDAADETPAREARDTRDAADETLEHKHPGQPQQTDSGYGEGLDVKPDTPEEELEPDFARGLRDGPEAEVEVHPRFSEGQEELPGTPDKEVERRFSEGLERSPTSE